MAECDQLHGGKACVLSVLAGTSHLCAGAIAGFGSALWLNVVGPFAAAAAAWGAFTLVNALAIVLVSVLAMLVTAAGSLVAADWRVDIGSREAWAEIATAGVEACLPAEAAAPSNIHPCYLVASSSERLRSVFRAHRQATPAPDGTRTPAVVPAARTIAEAGAPLPTLEASKATLALKIGGSSVCQRAMVCLRDRKSADPLQRQRPAVASYCRPRTKPAASAIRLVGNGDTWWFVGDRHVSALTDRRSADIVVLSGDRSNGNRGELRSSPSPSDGTVRRDEPLSCRGPPSTAGRRSHPMATVSVEWEPGDPRHASPRQIDPIVRDDFDLPIPVRAVELGVIETYLDQLLRDLLVSGSSSPGSDKS